MPFRHILAAKEHLKSMKIQAGAWRGLWRRLGKHLGSLLVHLEALEAENGMRDGRPGGMRGVPLSVEISTEFDRLVWTRPAPPRGGGGFN